MMRDKLRSVGAFMGRHHMAVMVLCCLIPIGIAALLSAFGVRNSAKGIGSFVYLLCPIMMIGMMFMPGHGHAQHGKTINITDDPDRVREGK